MRVTIARDIGIIGLGKMGVLHAGIAHSLSGVQVKAICEKNTLSTKFAKELLPRSVVFYDDYMTMIEDEELDAVFVATPIESHVPIVTDIAQTRKDLSLFVEKPLAVTHNQAQVACEAARGMKGIHMVGYQKRFSPVFQRAKQLVMSHSIGDLMFFRAHSFSSDVLRQGTSWRFTREAGGVLLDLAPHVLDMVMWFFGEPETVFATRRRIYSREVDDYVHAAMSFSDGLQGYVDVCWSMRDFRLPDTLIEVQGTNGNITVTDDYVKLEINGQNPLETSVQVDYKQSFDTSVSFLLADPEYTKEDEAFLTAIETEHLPELNFFEGSKVNALIDRIMEFPEGDRSA
ncbi:MAG: Gfo/Idh/MocA family protein [Candidatus Bathyarchaeia archaeon]